MIHLILDSRIFTQLSSKDFLATYIKEDGKLDYKSFYNGYIKYMTKVLSFIAENEEYGLSILAYGDLEKKIFQTMFCFFPVDASVREKLNNKCVVRSIENDANLLSKSSEEITRMSTADRINQTFKDFSNHAFVVVNNQICAPIPYPNMRVISLMTKDAKRNILVGVKQALILFKEGAQRPGTDPVLSNLSSNGNPSGFTEENKSHRKLLDPKNPLIISYAQRLFLQSLISPPLTEGPVNIHTQQALPDSEEKPVNLHVTQRLSSLEQAESNTQNPLPKINTSFRIRDKKLILPVQKAPGLFNGKSEPLVQNLKNDAPKPTYHKRRYYKDFGIFTKREKLQKLEMEAAQALVAKTTIPEMDAALGLAGLKRAFKG